MYIYRSDETLKRVRQLMNPFTDLKLTEEITSQEEGLAPAVGMAGASHPS
jgi:hypothetical protein